VRENLLLDMSYVSIFISCTHLYLSPHSSSLCTFHPFISPLSSFLKDSRVDSENISKLTILSREGEFSKGGDIVGSRVSCNTHCDEDDRDINPDCKVGKETKLLKSANLSTIILTTG
jgi:hypothetical protein